MRRVLGWFRRHGQSGFGSGTAAIVALAYVNGPADGISTDNALVTWDAATGRLVKNNSSGPFATGGKLGLNTAVPTHSVTLSSTAAGLALYNTADQVTNYERVVFDKAANVFTLYTEKGGTGTLRGFRVGMSTAYMEVGLQGAGTFVFAGGTPRFFTSSGFGWQHFGSITTTNTPAFTFGNLNSLTGSNTIQEGIQLALTVNQTSTAGYKALRIVVTETGTGSGQKDLASLETGAGVRCRIGQNGNVYASMQTAVPAGGAANTGYFFSSTAGFGVYYGSGAPTVTAAKGSLYLRSDGSGTNDRAYINTDGGTTWTALVTVA